jgi:anti-sigma factor RsiW
MEDDDPLRDAVEAHVKECAACAAEFSIWQDSLSCIRQSAEEVPAEIIPEPRTINRVMERIYQEDPWTRPVSHRIVHRNVWFQRTAAFVAAACMFFFLYALADIALTETSSGEAGLDKVTGLVPTASAAENETMNLVLEVPLASISDPVVVVAAPRVPDWFIALAVIGLTISLLLLNRLNDREDNPEQNHP